MIRTFYVLVCMLAMLLGQAHATNELSRPFFQAKREQPYHLSVGAVLFDEQGRIACHHFDQIQEFNDIYILMRESMEDGETPLMTLQRGLKEEFGASAVPIAFLGSLAGPIPFLDSSFEKTTLYIACRLTNWNPQSRAHDDPEASSTIEWHAPQELMALMKDQGVRFNHRIDTDESQIVERALPYIDSRQYSEQFPCAGTPIKTRVIINPKSGTGSKNLIATALHELLDPIRFDLEIFYTEGPGDATRLSEEAAELGYPLVIAIGGDGTVNEVGKALIGTDTALAIIPAGSGNGLARHLHIPTDPRKAIELIRKGRTKFIDTIRINDNYFLGVAGIGFDALIAWDFSQSERRGFLSYAALTLKRYPDYALPEIPLEVDGVPMTVKGLLVSFANSSQYGNDIWIAPQADLEDGYLDLVLLERPPFYALPNVFLKLKNGTITESPYYRSIRCKEVTIPQANIRAHIDGEPVLFVDGIHMVVNPKSLKLVF